MSVAVMPSSSATLHLNPRSWPAPTSEPYMSKDDVDDPPLVVEERTGEFHLWSSILSHKAAAAAADQPPYVHPLVRRSSRLLNRKSLEICTESLGSETGSHDFTSMDDLIDYCSPPVIFDDDGDHEKEGEKEEDVREYWQAVAEGVAQVRAVESGARRRQGKKELTSVDYHCSIGRRSPPRSFPPPLPSICRRGGLGLHMRPHRRDGRLVVEAVPVPSQNYLHAQRVDGRLLLSFIDVTFGYESEDASYAAAKVTQPQEEEDAKQTEAMEVRQAEEEEEELLEEEDEEEEVEVVDRGTVVEVKVSTQPQQQSGAMKVHRSSFVINKFVGGEPLSSLTDYEHPAGNDDNASKQIKHNHATASALAARRASPTTTTTAAAAVAAASTLSVVAVEGCNDHHCGRLWAPLGGHNQPLDHNKLLFTSKRRNREELLHNMRRCNHLRRPLFIWEPWCIATSS